MKLIGILCKTNNSINVEITYIKCVGNRENITISRYSSNKCLYIFIDITYNK